MKDSTGCQTAESEEGMHLYLEITDVHAREIWTQRKSTVETEVTLENAVTGSYGGSIRAPPDSLKQGGTAWGDQIFWTGGPEGVKNVNTKLKAALLGRMLLPAGNRPYSDGCGRNG